MAPLTSTLRRGVLAATSAARPLTGTSQVLLHRTSQAAPARTLSSTQQLRGGAGSGGDHYDPPGGWLWGRDPSKTYEKEGWEGLMFYGYGGAILLLVVGYAYKPDTSIQTWALEEARRRLETEGILPDPDVAKREG